MKRLAMVLAVAFGAFACFGVGTGVAGFATYAGPGESFSPGEGHGSTYDSFCSRWVDNWFNKAPNAYGLITFIDSNGNWSNSVQGKGSLYRKLSDVRWTKKLHCKNTSGSTYAAGCYGDRVTFQCA